MLGSSAGLSPTSCPWGAAESLGLVPLPQAASGTPPHPPCPLRSLRAFIPTQPSPWSFPATKKKIPERPRPCPRLNSPRSGFSERLFSPGPGGCSDTEAEG